MKIIVSIQNINACIALENQSKYSDSTAGTPTARNGMSPRISPTTPGMSPKRALFARMSAAYTSELMTIPDRTLPK